MQAYDLAIENGLRCLNIAKRSEDLYWIGHSIDKLAEICLAMEQPNQARAYLLDKLEWHLAIGQLWQNTWIYDRVFACISPACLKIVITLYLYYQWFITTHKLSPLFQYIIQGELPAIKSEMEETIFANAWNGGKDMDFDTAVSLIRAALQPQAEENP